MKEVRARSWASSRWLWKNKRENELRRLQRPAEDTRGQDWVTPEQTRCPGKRRKVLTGKTHGRQKRRLQIGAFKDSKGPMHHMRTVFRLVWERDAEARGGDASLYSASLVVPFPPSLSSWVQCLTKLRRQVFSSPQCQHRANTFLSHHDV